jgi:uncharacterized protein (TIGR02271 family)
MVMAQSGGKIGKVTDLYLDEETGHPEWLAINTGMFGARQSFVPISEVTERGPELCVPFSIDKVKDAPTVEADGHLSPTEEERLYQHYGIDIGGGVTGTGQAAPAQETAPRAGRDNAMTRSEEEVRVGTQRQEAGRARLRKWVETEHVTQTVPVQREEARVVREPVTEQNIDRATSGPDFRENVHEMTLNEERVTVQKETVPKERVRLEKEVITEQQPVEADIRKEHIDVDQDRGGKRRGR